MTTRRAAFGVLVLLAMVLSVVVAREIGWVDAYRLWPSRNAFTSYPLPYSTTQQLMDIGVADVNGDDVLDIFMSNHNYRQTLWVADGRGNYVDMVSAWGLDQSPDFPGLEIMTNEPVFDKPGVYIYWKGRETLAVRTHGIESIGRVRGTLRTFTFARHFVSEGFRVRQVPEAQATENSMTERVVEFESDKDGLLQMRIASPGVPMTIRLDELIPLSNIYVGSQKISPRAHEFELALQDPHGLAWADYNDDGMLDVFITRGAIGGTLRAFPGSVANRVKDQLFVTRGKGKYQDLASELGIEKRGCSGRGVKWVDFNHDGLLDLYIICQERGVLKGRYPKQLYRQNPDKRFTDVAEQVGLEIANQEVIDFSWFDADGDGDMDMLTSEEDGFFLYRNQSGTFVREFLGRGTFARADLPKIRGAVDQYWATDGKIAVADYDGDGNLDVFSSSKKGNALLTNRGGKFSVVEPGTVGLPGESATAVWVDYDNDGLVDLYAVPQGIFRQRRDHTFEATGLLALPPQKYLAAIVNWADLDNDGARDVVIARLENYSLWRWWEQPFKESENRFTWKLQAFRNAAKGNHWLEVRVDGRPGNPQAIGARVTVKTADGAQTQEVGLNDGAYFSQGHYRLYFGLGPHPRVATLEVRWPDGKVQELNDVEGNRLLVIKREGD